jgi:hypothetical protein
MAQEDGTPSLQGIIDSEGDSSVSQILVFSNKVCAEGVHLERMTRLFFQASRLDIRGYWILYIHM